MLTHVRQFNFSKMKCPPTTPKTRKGVEYINAPFTFDIETTSYINTAGDKRAFMYIFMFSLNGKAVYGRHWADFYYTLDKLKQTLGLNDTRKLIIYVHNLPYEFQFLQGRCEITDVFARTSRHPMKCTVNKYFEFRCSYILSGLGLAKTADQITIHRIRKMTGDLDYRKIRHADTPLTAQEMKYCEHDVQVLYWYILQEIRQNDGLITKIPMTRTSYVRRYCYDHIKNNTQYGQYRAMIKRNAPIDVDLFTLMHKCFAGGYTHANCLHVDTICDNVGSIDFTSSYPAQMVRHKYPMGEFKQVTPQSLEMFERYIKYQACLIEIVLKNVTAKQPNHIISASKCQHTQNAVYDNGRIVSADIIHTFVTDIDYHNIMEFYNVSEIAVVKMYVARYGYLPDEFVKCVLGLFADKTTLKGVSGKEQEYLLKKGMLNSTYGMMCTCPLNDEYNFISHADGIGGEWAESEVDPVQALSETYLKKYNQTLLYQWGVWVTAWARHELYRAVLHMGIDVVYCDTDSVKYLHPEKYVDFITEYNSNVINDMYARCDMLGVSRDMVEPRTIHGNKTPLGVFDQEPTYAHFKTLGAKRYMFSHTADDSDINITVAGLNKKSCVPYIIAKSKQLNITPFDFFTDNMYIPAQWVHDGVTDYPTGKNTLSYIDDPFSERVTDYLGNTATVSENTYIHMCEQDYNLGMSTEFLQFIAKCEYVPSMPTPNKPQFLKILEME